MSDDEETHSIVGVRGCVLLIDVSPSMWIEHEKKKPVDFALDSCLELLRKMIIESPKQLIGLSLYGTEKNDDKGIGNVIEIIKLAEPTVEAVTKLKALVMKSVDIITNWGSTDDFNLSDALWQGSKMFSECKKVMNSQSVFLLSCMGEPDINTHRVVLKKAKDLKELNIGINFINVSNESVSHNSFFVELGKVIVDAPDMEWELPEPVTCVEDLVPLLWSSHNRASAYASLKFMFSPAVYMGVKLYYLQKAKTKPRKIFLNRDTNEPVKSYTSMHSVRDEEDGEHSQGSQEDYNMESHGTNTTSDLSNTVPVSRSDITHTVTFGQRRICLSDSEMFMLKTFAGHPCIKLLGFKPETVLNMPEFYLKNSAFLYPNEKDVEGSTTLFLALRDRCMAKGCIPICLLIPRWRSHATPVALIPQKRVMNGARQVYPDGFHVVYLPYADNMKEVPLSKPTDLTLDQKHCMENIVNKIKINYDDNTFENPTLQQFYKALEALALEEDLQTIEDTTKPEVKEQDERLGDLIEKFCESFGPMDKTSVKRSKNDDKPKKCQATEKSNGDLETAVEYLRNDDLKKCKVDQLKLLVRSNTVTSVPALSGLKKDELIQIVNENKQNILASIANK